MKLLNYTLLIFSLALFAILTLWSVLFYFQMLSQVKSTIDDGLANYKILIIDQVKDDTLVDQRDDFLTSNYIIREVSDTYALQVRDTYKDTATGMSLLKGKSRIMVRNCREPSYRDVPLTAAAMAAPYKLLDDEYGITGEQDVTSTLNNTKDWFPDLDGLGQRRSRLSPCYVPAGLDDYVRQWVSEVRVLSAGDDDA